MDEQMHILMQVTLVIAWKIMYNLLIMMPFKNLIKRLFQNLRAERVVLLYYHLVGTAVSGTHVESWLEARDGAAG